MKIQFTVTEEELKKFANELALRIKNFPEGGQTLFLSGVMGAGKTTFSRYFCESLGIKNASSPTFSLVEKDDFLDTNGAIAECIHADFYRANTERISEVIEEELESNQKEKIFLLEWFPKELIDDFFYNVPKIFIDFSHSSSDLMRNIEIYFENPWSVDVPTAYTFLDGYKTPVHVKKHITNVKNVATYIGLKLQKNKIPIDIELVEASAILHDGVRYVDFPSFEEKDFERYDEEVTPEKIMFWKSIKEKYKTMHHAQAMADILEKGKKFATARVVLSHMTGQIYLRKNMSWEEICVYYADKRCLHDSFVSLEERLDDGKKRYAHERNPGLEEKLFALEEKIFKNAKIDKTFILAPILQ